MRWRTGARVTAADDADGGGVPIARNSGIGHHRDVTRRGYVDGIGTQARRDLAVGQRLDELQQSLEAAKGRKPLFEAGFVYNGGFARVDILNPVGKNEWDIIEVKSSTEVKDVNLLDLAFQAFVYTGAGLNIRRCCLMHVNRDYVRRGPVDPKEFFKVKDVTKDVSGLSREIEPQLEDMFSTIRRTQEPEIKIGPHCSDPYACPLTDKCWSFLPPDSVFDLYYGGKKCWRLLQDGVVNLKDIPESVDLTDRQAIQRFFPEASDVAELIELRRPIVQRLIAEGKELAPLREQGVLILGSGNLVHNLMMLGMHAKPYPWALEFDMFVKNTLVSGNYEPLIGYPHHPFARTAHPTSEHFLPLLCVIGAAGDDRPWFFNETIFAGSVSMRCVVFGMDPVRSG